MTEFSRRAPRSRGSGGPKTFETASVSMQQVEALAAAERGCEFMENGDVDAARSWFEKSIATCLTAEGCTYWGWMLSFEGRIEEAIHWCKKAIDLDPEFGNPYNDIGAYMMAQGNFDGAIPWFEQAKTAQRYEARHYPFTNLARIFICKGQLKRADQELQQARVLSPDDPEVEQLIEAVAKGLH